MNATRLYRRLNLLSGITLVSFVFGMSYYVSRLQAKLITLETTIAIIEQRLPSKLGFNAATNTVVVDGHLEVKGGISVRRLGLSVEGSETDRASLTVENDRPRLLLHNGTVDVRNSSLSDRSSVSIVNNTIVCTLRNGKRLVVGIDVDGFPGIRQYDENGNSTGATKNPK